MSLFAPENATRSDRHRRIHAYYEIAHTAADFLAAILFLVGSVLFFYPQDETLGVWFFVVGSFFFAVKPTLHLAREIHLLAIGDFEDLTSPA